MHDSNSRSAGPIGLARKAALTGIAALENRGELLFVEFQEEKNRVIELLIWAVVVCFLGILFITTFTATIIWLFRSDLRLYAAAGFCLLYFVGSILAILNLKALAKKCPPAFSDSIAELKKDREWLESLK